MTKQQMWTYGWLVVAGLCFLGGGALWQSQQFSRRGIPAQLPEPMAHSGVQVGVNVYLEQHDDPQATLLAISEVGVQYVKQTVYYGETDEAVLGQWLQAADAVGVEMVLLLNGRSPIPPADFAQWGANLAQRFGEQLTYYIIWDEPNLSSQWGGEAVNPNEYTALLADTATAIRAQDSDAVIVMAPLAPTIETGPQNLSESLFLQEVYSAGAAPYFDVVMAKPYGFDSGAEDRRVEPDSLNFSRPILLRELMVAQGDGHKPIWAGNWGWNSLPAGWQGAPSVWGQTTPAQKAEWVGASLQRAEQEWPWMGVMFLENWAFASQTDPVAGFAIAQTPTEEVLKTYIAERETAEHDMSVALPGFHLASNIHPAQQFIGGWEFSPEFGADMSEVADGAPPDKVTFTFWGTDVGLRVRRANFRARLYVTVDGQPANALPSDENGTMLILTAADPTEDYVTIEPIAQNLPAGVHTVEIVASRGWDQWALHGFSVGYQPPLQGWLWGQWGLWLFGLVAFGLAIWHGWQTTWTVPDSLRRLSERTQIALTGLMGVIVTLTGWLTWGDGLYRRLGDVGQVGVTAVVATLFYVTPTFYVYVLALLLLFMLIYLRPAWGLALVTLTMPFYVPSLTKPVFSYRFSPVELFTLVTFGAVLLRGIVLWGNGERGRLRLNQADYAVLLFGVIATLSLFFTARLGVALNEWRVVIFEPILFYGAFRVAKPTEQELWLVLDAFLLSGATVAGYGLWQYGFDTESLITAEAGLQRVRAFYGSPNNVALFLGRVLPVGIAVWLIQSPIPRTRRWLYGLAGALMGITILLSFSRGGILLGVPSALLVIFWCWQVANGRRTLPYLILFALLGVVAFVGALQIPQLAGRLDPQSMTGVFRINLWRSSLNMIAEHPVWGVGLDNFLYEYRGRYIMDSAWQEPNLNHPHNLVLDFATRLGLLGLLVGGWMLWANGRLAYHLTKTASPIWLPVAVGLLAALADIVAHGLVDHSFFLVDLAFVFMLLLAVGQRIQELRRNSL